MEGMADVDDNDSSWEALIDPETDIPDRLVGNGNQTVRRRHGSKLTCTIVNGVRIGAYMYLYRDGGKTLHLTDHPAGLAV
jgi:hypothetical protein